MKLIWSKVARADLASVHDFYREIGSEIAIQIAEEAVTAARFLQSHPSIGAPVIGTNKRKWRVPRTRYILIYRIERNRLRIIRLLHGARDRRKFLA